MTTVALFLALGVLFLAGEIFLPGLVLGVLGIVAMAAGTAAAFFNFGTEAGGLTALGALALVVLTFWLEFSVFPKTRLARALSLTATNGPPPPPVADPAAVVGRECVARTLMTPGGLVELDGRSYEALCRSGQAAPGERLKVVDVSSFQLIVTQPTKNP
jgi:membrane-bound serine protease (ClpP class)